MACRTVEILIILSDLQGHSPVANFFQMGFLCGCATVGKVLTDLLHRADRL